MLRERQHRIAGKGVENVQLEGQEGRRPGVIFAHRIQGAHALVEGQLGHYSVHLGSAVVHRQPGGAVCIVAASQQRGRLFLPFVDNDPKTAEAASKVLLLARNKEIKDPVILEQLLAQA